MSEEENSEYQNVESPSLVIMSDVQYSSSSGTTYSSSDTRSGSAKRGKGDLKADLLRCLAGLDRGVAAFPTDQRRVDDAATALERSAQPSPQLNAAQVDDLGGRWRLVYSSGFGSGSLGGRRPGPPPPAAQFGQVFQDIDTQKQQLDNVVELCFRPPSLPFWESDPEPVVVELTLRHSYRVSEPSTVTITFEGTSVDFRGPLAFLRGLPSFSLPELPPGIRPPADLRSASFDVTFLDGDMRITRGDRGELRIYLAA